MTKEEIQLELQNIQPMFPGCPLELVSFENNEAKLKVTGLPNDIFKIQGKEINSGDETKNSITSKLKERFGELTVTFI